MVEYLLKTQRDPGHWTGQMCRPPMEESYQTCTTLAVQGIRRFATDNQRPRADIAIARARNWLLKAPAKGQEDKAARLWGLSLFGESPEALEAARQVVLTEQRSDGGWAQLDEMTSDAYATGQTLYALQSAGYDLKAPAYQKGLQFLLKTQRSDGNWLVVSRSKPLQPYYDSDDDDPLGKNQFISVPATSWAVAALLATIGRPE
jgi:N-acyl-D-amino-acid deacylase